MLRRSRRTGSVFDQAAPNANRMLRSVTVMLVASGAGLLLMSSASPQARHGDRARTRTEGLAAWQQVYSVLTSPRCINCHTATNYPQQGDDRHRHFATVIRGPEGKGVAGLNCASCHQETNADSTGVPGGHNWHLAPLSMRWQDLNDEPLSSAAVCRAITDQSKNHNLDGPGLLKHHEEEALVRWAWQPGRRPDGTMRTLPPLTHEEFVAATRRWVEAGTPCPPGR
jgi:mono/diheme cytochrome c family protein